MERTGGPQLALAPWAPDLQLADLRVDRGGGEPLLLLVRHGFDQVIPAVRLLTLRAHDEDVGEVVHMSGGLQARFREDRRRVDEVVVVREAEEVRQPEVLPFPLQAGADVTVIVEAREPAVEVHGGPQECAADGEGQEIVIPGGHRAR